MQRSVTQWTSEIEAVMTENPFLNRDHADVQPSAESGQGEGHVLRPNMAAAPSSDLMRLKLRQQQHQQQQEDHHHQQQQQQSSGTDAAPTWDLHVDPSSGRSYWHNTATGETTWEDRAKATVI